MTQVMETRMTEQRDAVGRRIVQQERHSGRVSQIAAQLVVVGVRVVCVRVRVRVRVVVVQHGTD